MGWQGRGGDEMADSRTGTEAIPSPVDSELTPGTFIVASAPREARMGLLRQMLVSLEDATTGGHGYLMAKVLILFRRELLELDARFTTDQRALVDHALDELEHEAARLSPEPLAFQRGARTLVDLFALA
jgi:uncharacterized protein (DUF1778 family)